ncbi:MAG TPA: sodium:solute symporter [Chthoniobacterales bacterium]|nr:sodium:solute symporter [Chthoniobacterales bacterium]
MNGRLAIDIGVLLVYFTVIIFIGLYMGRKEDNLEDFALGGRRIPWWAVLASIIAAETSAGTFFGTPGEGFALRNYTYLQLAFGTIIARVLVSYIFIKPYYDYKVYSIYEYLTARFGVATKNAASAIFMITRLLASGARLYVAAIALALAYEMIRGVRPGQLETLYIYIGATVAIVILTAIYTTLGGIKAVIWTDLIQASIMIGSALVALGLLYFSIPGGWAEIRQRLNDFQDVKLIDTGFPREAAGTVQEIAAGDTGTPRSFSLQEQEVGATRDYATNNPWIATSSDQLRTGDSVTAFYREEHDKRIATAVSDSPPPAPVKWWAKLLTMFAIEYTIFAGLFGATFITMATHGTDQDMVQRMLTAPDVRRSRRSLILSGLADIPIVLTFLSIGILLWVYYQAHPDPNLPKTPNETFCHFILYEMPVGLRGLLIAGIFATAMGSLSTAINALATSFTRDWYQPYINPRATAQQSLRAVRWATVWFSVLMIVVASATSYLVIVHPTIRIIPIVLGIFGYTYGSLLGVFLCGMFTRRRGNNAGNIIAMIAGFMVVAFLSGLPNALGRIVGTQLYRQPSWLPVMEFPWWICFGTIVTFGVAILFRTEKDHQRPTG